MSIRNAINKAIDKKDAGGWKRWPQLFWAIDLHDTVIKATYKNTAEVHYFPNAKRVLKRLTEREDMYIILWTGTHKDLLAKYIEQMIKDGIDFDAVNENSRCESDNLRAVDEKLYFDILLDDKAGFNGNTQWFTVQDALEKKGLW